MLLRSSIRRNASAAKLRGLSQVAKRYVTARGETNTWRERADKWSGSLKISHRDATIDDRLSRSQRCLIRFRPQPLFGLSARIRLSDGRIRRWVRARA